MRESGRINTVLRILWLCFALGCAAYSVIIYAVGSGTSSYIIWIMGTVFFSMLFFLSGKGRWGKVPKIVRIISYVVIGVGLVVFLTAQVLILSHFADKGDKNADYMIVLGAQMKNSGPSVAYKYRLDAAYEYLINNPNTICVVSGMQGVNEPIAEGTGGVNYLISRGIPKERLIAEDNAEDTDDNITFGYEIIKEHNAIYGSGKDVSEISVVIVTNNYHVFRGIGLARKGMPCKVSGLAGKNDTLYIPNAMVRETLGILKDITEIKLR